MENWSKPAEKGSGKGVKKRKVSSGKEVDVLQLVGSIGLLSLETARSSRQFSGGLMHTFLAPLHGVFDDAILISTNSDGKQPVLDCSNSWAKLVLSFSKLTFQNPEINQAVQTLVKHAQEVGDASQLDGVLHHCRVCLTHDRLRTKVQVWVDAPLLPQVSAIQQIIIHMGGEATYGSPPRTALERRVARELAAAGIARQR
jgi:hypothetical protein